MTTPTPQFEQRLSDWLADDATSSAPDGLADAVVERTANTGRLPGWAYRDWWWPAHVAAGVGPSVRAGVMLALLALLTAVVVGILVMGAEKPLPPPVGPADNGLIAFERDADIYVSEPDGTEIRPLVATEAIEWGPMWSPDGTQLAYWDAPPDEWGFWDPNYPGNYQQPMRLRLVGLRGEVPKTLVQDVVDPSFGMWEPDGSGLIYQARESDPRIFRAPIDGSGAVMIGEADLRAWSPRISPDGQTIAVLAGNFDAERGLFLMDRDGSDRPQLGTDQDGRWVAGWDPVLDWAPDGSALLMRFPVEGGLGHELWIIHADGSASHRLTEGRVSGGDFWIHEAAWSPSGDRVAYLLTTNATRVNIADVVTGLDHELEEPLVNHAAGLAWAPDGSRVLAELAPQTNADPPRLAVIDPDGVEPMEVIESAGRMSWQRVAE